MPFSYFPYIDESILHPFYELYCGSCAMYFCRYHVYGRYALFLSSYNTHTHTCTVVSFPLADLKSAVPHSSELFNATGFPHLVFAHKLTNMHIVLHTRLLSLGRQQIRVHIVQVFNMGMWQKNSDYHLIIALCVSKSWKGGDQGLERYRLEKKT